MVSRAVPVDTELGDAVAQAHDSVTVAGWTAISRVTGLVRVAVVAAVLGPTFLGNTYQFTNSVPNLVYYGLLGGALVSSLLVPAVVRVRLAGDEASAAALVGGFLGAALAAAAVCAPLIVVVVPLVLRAGSLAASPAIAHAQASAALVLVALLIPQVACYAVIASCVAVMNAHRRFALAAGAPSVENLGTIAVLVAAWAWYGLGREVTHVGAGELVLLGGGTTAAVVMHAGLQWYGARRVGVRLRPSAGWRDPRVRAVLRRASLAVGQAGLWSAQVVVLLALANRVAGGVVAAMIALNFFYLPVALGAAPIALSALPHLAQHSLAGQPGRAADATVRALATCLLVTVPAAAGYLVEAHRLASVVSFGSAGAARTSALISVALTAIACGVVAQGVFTVASYAAYSREDARTPVRAMAWQAAAAIPLMGMSLAVHGRSALAVLGAALGASTFVGAVALLHGLRLGRDAWRYLARSSARAVACASVMAIVVWPLDHVLGRFAGGRGAQAAVLGVVVLVGAIGYVAAQRLMRSPELDLLVRGVQVRRRDAARVRTVLEPDS